MSVALFHMQYHDIPNIHSVDGAISYFLVIKSYICWKFISISYVFTSILHFSLSVLMH